MDLEWLVGVGDVRAVQDQLHDEQPVLLLLEAVDLVLLSRTERSRVLVVHLHEQLSSRLGPQGCGREGRDLT